MHAHAIRFAATAVLLCLSATVVAEEEVDGEQSISALLRVAITVSDIEVSKRFYSYALGYSVGFEGDITSPWVTDLLQLHDGQTARFVVLKGGDTIGGQSLSSAMIGLMQIDNPPLQKLERPGEQSLAAGESVMAIVTEDIAVVYDRLLELNARVLHPPTIKPNGSETELVVYDPDGVRIHVVQSHYID